MVKAEWKGRTIIRKRINSKDRMVFVKIRPKGVPCSVALAIEIRRSFVRRSGKKYLDLGLLFL